MRNTYWKSSVFNYESWDSWMAKGGKDAYSRAHAEVERILHAHYPPQVVVSPEVQAEMKTIVDEAIDLPELFETGLFKYTYLL
jgi:trimethylamine:corrinoid methyltransferase-like protein